LVTRKYGKWSVKSSSPKGGRPSQRFVLFGYESVDTTSSNLEPEEVLSGATYCWVCWVLAMPKALPLRYVTTEEQVEYEPPNFELEDPVHYDSMEGQQYFKFATARLA
jgi:hypothetical protein